MGIFIFVKQIVDLIYEIKALDVVMVLFAIGLIVYKFIKQKSFFSYFIKHLCLTDYLIVILAFLYLFSLSKNLNGLSACIKIESAMLIYFLGRVYADEIMKHGHKLALAGYIIIYSNLIYMAAHQIYLKCTGMYFPWEPYEIANGGGLYYYKTDLGLGFVFAVLFIYLFGKNKWLKLITSFVISPLVLLGTDARMGQAVMCAMLVALLIRDLTMYIRKKRETVTAEIKDGAEVAAIKSENESKANIKAVRAINVIFIIAAILVLSVFIAIQVSPVKDTDYYGTGVSEELDDRIEDIFHSRHVIWWDTFHYMANESFVTRLFGVDLTSLPGHNQRHMMSHCLYVNMFYAIGYLGITLMMIFLYRTMTAAVKQNDEKKFLVIALWMIFLVFGISADTMEYTQVSWFPFMMAGMVLTQSDSVNNTAERK